jgi:hypothetical protein
MKRGEMKGEGGGGREGGEGGERKRERGEGEGGGGEEGEGGHLPTVAINAGTPNIERHLRTSM